MKNRILISSLMLSLFLANVVPSIASNGSAWNSRMVNRQREAIPKAIRSYINVWAACKSQLEYADPLQRILRGQTLLLSYGVDINDELLVADLFEENGKPVSYALFGSRLLYHELEKEAGWKPDRNAPLINKEYMLTLKQANIQPGEIQFPLQTR